MSPIPSKLEVVTNFRDFFLVFDLILSLLIFMLLEHHLLVFSRQAFLVALREYF